MGCNCGKRKMTQVTSANIGAGTAPADDAQVEAMVAGASTAERHNERVRLSESASTRRTR